MLTAIRTKASSWIIKVLLFLLVGSFALWGIGDIVRGFQRDPAVATVNGDGVLRLGITGCQDQGSCQHQGENAFHV